MPRVHGSWSHTSTPHHIPAANTTVGHAEPQSTRHEGRAPTTTPSASTPSFVASVSVRTSRPTTESPPVVFIDTTFTGVRTMPTTSTRPATTATACTHTITTDVKQPPCWLRTRPHAALPTVSLTKDPTDGGTPPPVTPTNAAVATRRPASEAVADRLAAGRSAAMMSRCDRPTTVPLERSDSEGCICAVRAPSFVSFSTIDSSASPAMLSELCSQVIREEVVFWEYGAAGASKRD